MKKVFNVHFAIPESDKTEVKYFVADNLLDVVRSLSVDEGLQVVGVTFGPDVEVL